MSDLTKLVAECHKLEDSFQLPGAQQRAFDPDQPRDKDGKFTMGNVASFKNEKDGVEAHVTSFNGKFHVNLIDTDSGGHLPSSIFSGEGAKEKAIAQAKKLVGLRYSPDQPRDDHGRFGEGSSSGPDKEGKWAVADESKMEEHFNKMYPEVQEGDRVDGREVLGQVDNMSSIGASFSNYLILEGIREVDFNQFDMPPDITPRTKELAEKIKQSSELTPLIVGIDHKGPYIVEGSHRYDALKILGATKIPAVVVLDLDELQREERSLRYSPDQPRDPDGKFGSGMSSNEAKNAYDPTVPAPNLERWQAGEHQTMQGDATIALKAGTPGKDPMLNAIRNETFDKYIYRGLALDKNDPLMAVKSGDLIQLEPSSFSFDRGIAEEFSTQTLMDGQVPVILTVGPAGPGGDPHGIVIGDRGDSAYGPSGYDQKEVVTAGHFRVAAAKNKRGPDGIYRLISLRQEGIF